MRIKSQKSDKKTLITIFLILNVIFISFFSNQVMGIDPANSITLGAYEYYDIPVNASDGQSFSGDWDVFPADVISPPFLVFIVDDADFSDWAESDNLTQAISRIPSDNFLYLYDPLFRLDDIPLDNRRSGTINVNVPYEDTWHLVLYAGATLVPLTFSWHIDVVNSLLLNAILYGFIGIIGLGVIITFTIISIKQKKVTPEEEFEKILAEQKNGEKGLGSLENSESIEELE